MNTYLVYAVQETREEVEILVRAESPEEAKEMVEDHDYNNSTVIDTYSTEIDYVHSIYQQGEKVYDVVNDIIQRGPQ